jgi:hypothetical protein
VTTSTPGHTPANAADYERIRARAEMTGAAATLGVLNLATAGVRLAMLNRLLDEGAQMTASEVRRTKVATGLSLALGLAATATAFADPLGTRGRTPMMLSRAASVASWLVPFTLVEQREASRAAARARKAAAKTASQAGKAA